MPDVFITLEEAATFESVKYNTLVQRMKRNPEQYRTQAQAQEGGGKDRTLSLWADGVMAEQLAKAALT